MVGVSGGSDSLALLKVLSSVPMSLDLIAVYVDHGLRPMEIPAEIDRISAICRELDIAFIVKKIDVRDLATSEGRSIEDAARMLRYQSFETVRKQHNARKVAVGHHSDDQAEEFFIRLVRGTGVTGLTGMKPQNQNIIRPLLFETKESIQAYLIDHNITWSEDSSNKETHFLRNKVRLQLIPLLEQHFNPQIKKTVLSTMDVLQEENSLLEEMAEDQFSRCTHVKVNSTEGLHPDSLSLSIEDFSINHLAIRRRILEIIFWVMDSKPSYSAIFDINTLVEAGENGNELHCKNGLRIVKRNTQILFTKPRLAANNRGNELSTEPFEQVVDGPGSYPINNTPYTVTISEVLNAPVISSRKKCLYIALEKIDFPLTLRTSYPGERITINEGAGRKKISRYFNEVKLDKRKRPSWPILASNHEVIAIIGYATNWKYRADDNNTRQLCISLEIDDGRT